MIYGSPITTRASSTITVETTPTQGSTNAISSGAAYTIQSTAAGNSSRISSVVGGNAWVSGTSYAVGDMCIYLNNVYRCVTANSDVTFTSINWESISLKTLYNREAGESYTDLSDYLTVYDNRLSVAKKIVRLYDDGRFYLFAQGTLVTTLSSSQTSLYILNYPSAIMVEHCGLALLPGRTITCSFSNAHNLNLDESATHYSGTLIILKMEYYIQS